MLKKSLITAVILGAIVASAGANSEEKVEKAKRFRAPQPELVLDAPRTTCEADANEAQDASSSTNILGQQNSSQLEELGATYAYSYSYTPRRRCYVCSYICIVVYC